MFIAAGAVVAALLGYFVAVPLLRGTAKPVASTLTATGPPVTGTAAAAPAAAPTATPRIVPKTFSNVVGRAPFAPLVTAPAAAAAAASTATPTTPAAAASTAPTTTPGKTTFKVISATATRATVSVDGKTYTPSTGQVFAKSFKLLKISSGSCGSFAHGEMRISLCKGQTFIF